MCNIKPLKIKKIKGNKLFLEDGIVALYDPAIGAVKKEDYVLVYGNLAIKKIYAKLNP